jgi:transposase
MLSRQLRFGKRAPSRFAAPPWNCDHPRWQELDRQLPADHVARSVVAAMTLLDWSALYRCYRRGGSKATDPVLMLRLVLIELQSGRFRPQQWWKDTQENEALKWAGFGICPSRSAWYAFHDRVGPILEACHQQLLERAIRDGVASAAQASLDGTALEANASRHRMINEDCLTRRQMQLAEACAADRARQTASDPPQWMAKTPETREEQRLRYDHAGQRLRELQAVNARQDRRRRRDPKKIVVSPSDPEATPGWDKFHVFRPLYNVQMVCDLNSSLVLAYDVLPQATDAGAFRPMLQKVLAVPGLKLQDLLVDAGYVTANHLALCARVGVTLYGPWQENDFSEARREEAAGKKLFSKRQFTWLVEDQVYVCPQGHPLAWIGQQKRPQASGEINIMHSYRCSPHHCCACPLSKRCTINPKRGRSVKRSEHEPLIDAHRARMATAEAKALYKRRKQTVELGFADVKQHRALRRFPRRGLQRARTHVGLLLLAHNLLAYQSVAARRRDHAA